MARGPVSRSRLGYRTAAVGGKRPQRLPNRFLGDDTKASRRSHHVRVPPHECVSPNHRGVRPEAAAADDVRAAGGCRGGRAPVVVSLFLGRGSAARPFHTTPASSTLTPRPTTPAERPP